MRVEYIGKKIFISSGNQPPNQYIGSTHLLAVLHCPEKYTWASSIFTHVGV